MSQISAYDKLNPAPQLQPLDWNFMAKAKELQDNRQGKLIDLLGDAGSKLPLEGGYATQEVAKEYNKNIDSVLESFRDRIVKGENPMKVYADLRSAASRIQTDPVYQGVVADRAKKDEIDKRLKSDPLYKGVQRYFDPNTQSFQQTTIEDLASGKFNPESWYKHIMPGNSFSEYEPIYKSIIADVTRKYDPATTEQYYDEFGNFVVKSTQNGSELETITPEKVFEIGKKMAFQENSGFMNLPNNQYIQAKLNQDADFITENNISPELTAAELFRDNYPSYYAKQRETQPIIRQSTIKDPTKNADGSKKDGSDLSPNPITNAFDTASTQGVATVSDINAISAIMGGSTPTNEGTFKVSLSGSPTILKFGNSDNPEEQRDAEKVKVYTEYKNLVADVAEKYDREIDLSTFSGKDWLPGGANRKIIESGTKQQKQQLLKSLGYGLSDAQMSTLLKVIDKNKALGINLLDPNSKTSIEMLASDPRLALVADLSIGLENTKGTVDFRPNRENNLGTTDTEDFTIDGNAERTKTQIVYMLNSDNSGDGEERFKEAEKLGLIMHVGDKMVPGLKGPVLEAVYEIPISKVVKTDIAAATNDYYTYSGNPNLAKEVKGQYDRVTKEWYPKFTQKAAAARLVKPFVEADADGFISGLEAGVGNITSAPYKESLTRGLETARRLLAQNTKAGKLQALQALGTTLNALNEQLEKEGKQPIKLK